MLVHLTVYDCQLFSLPLVSLSFSLLVVVLCACVRTAFSALRKSSIEEAAAAEKQKQLESEALLRMGGV